MKQSRNNRTEHTCIAVLWFVVSLAGSTADAPTNYSVDWFTLDGGGGTSTNGQFVVSGTVGQSDAGRLTGDGFSVEGGFWGVLLVVHTPGAPSLFIRMVGNDAAVVSWPLPATGWNLQQSTHLAQSNWTTPPETVCDDGTNKFILIKPVGANRFFRLWKEP